MGRIKTRFIKRAVKDIIKKHDGKFSDKFDRNKKGVTEVAEVRSKKLRNVIAGYVTKQKKPKKKSSGGRKR